MYLEDFRDIVAKLKEGKEFRSNYVNSLYEADCSLSDYVVENKYVNSVCMENDLLISKLFGTELAEDVFWYLYDCKQGSKIVFDDVTYEITDFKSYIDYVNNVYKLPMKPSNE